MYRPLRIKVSKLGFVQRTGSHSIHYGGYLRHHGRQSESLQRKKQLDARLFLDCTEEGKVLPKPFSNYHKSGTGQHRAKMRSFEACLGLDMESGF
jgi:hypothetical protein